MNTQLNIPPEELEIIERYLLRQMPTGEYNAFTKLLSENKELQEKTKSVKLMIIGIQENILQQKMESFHNEIPPSIPVINSAQSKLSSVKRWLIAASVILLVGIGLFWALSDLNQASKLYASFYEPDPGLISPMSATDTYIFDKAMVDYKIQRYDSAIKAWKSLLPLQPGNDTLQYFIGSAYLAKNTPDSAEHYLRKVAADTSSYFYNEANWYTGMALIKIKKYKEAIPYIEKSNHIDKERLLSKLKQ